LVADSIVRIAVWSGPRNISTALMRSWGNRADTVVVDEPFYAHYLLETGVDHPGRDAVIASQETDWKRVVSPLTEGDCGDAAIQYQKQMAHHLRPGMIGDWLLGLRSVLLVRDPAAMLLSLSRVLPSPTLADTGLEQQVLLARWLSEATDVAPAVIDSRSILEHPTRGLGALCQEVGVGFSPDMLSWPAGPRDTDGVWARHWYANVEASTGFQAWRPPETDVPDPLRGVLSECEALHAEVLSLCRRIG
jgi:sulfotransferase family protein